MKFMIVFAISILMLAGCAGSGTSQNSSHASSGAAMGESVREVSAYGFVTQVSITERVINIKHAPIPEMNWAPMVMNFDVVEGVDLSPYERGDKVQFVLEVDAEQNYRIKDIKAAAH
ncbi:copper-binding protein [Alkalimarinus coralli]|uniref:copper-binding protein n=1 Tax=Alkalimarinus coralli TaxID=2935863 RepID=UPI00202B77E0|nr:copper-binding protein [Alkalimarinus coralli]